MICSCSLLMLGARFNLYLLLILSSAEQLKKTFFFNCLTCVISLPFTNDVLFWYIYAV